ncbi:alpha-N-acetylgalactosaminidase-like isoform X4 [Pectinophora gossypiella]|uniref:alpha-N-acetylgalactosaminidase-like isoform X4 n=1 Tax=Pectinophora gossypiella TaxID=13191 RepID=UPI00214F39CF|nr:alpha-N-acetylgalactosaminidase-like isoform X4 [Pectinophora gossypiella]
MLMFLFLLGLVPTTLTLDNGLALTPPMGWMTWQRFRRITDCEKYPRDCISEELIKRTADKLVEDGYLEAGYEYLIIDDCWSQKHRSSDGRLMPDRKRFKSGMKALADYIHSKGFKFGMYQNYSNVTCAGYPGIMDYEDIDIASFVEWEIDYLKLDACYIDPLKLDTAYPEFGRKLNASGRPIVFSCSWPAYQESYNIKKPNYTSIAETCNLWRVLGDIEDSWAVLSNVIDWYGHNQDRIAPNAGPGQWNDPDMEIWSRELADRSYAVAFISKKDYGAPYPEHNFTFTQMKLPEGKYKVRDLYLKENVPSFGPDGTFPVRINPTGVKFFKFIPKETENEVYNK